MTYAELLAERLNASMLAQRDQILFGAGYVRQWVDEEGNARSKHVPIDHVELPRWEG